MSVLRSPLYNNSGSVPFASRLSTAVRRNTYELFERVMAPTAESRVLDLGVTNDQTFEESNFFERYYPHKDHLMCVGTENGSYLEEAYPGIQFVQVKTGEPLPFTNHEFDIVFSNAVLEHVGNNDQQRQFVEEACRVGTRVFITTPNRLFPVEHHTGVPFLHYLPKTLYRSILRRTSLSYWSFEENLNALNLEEFGKCFSSGYAVKTQYVGIGWWIFRSNLVAYSL